MRQRDIDELLTRLSQLDSSDARSLLRAIFPLARHESGRTIDYMNKAGHLALSLSYTAKGSIHQLRAKEGLTADDLNSLRDALDAFLVTEASNHFVSLWFFSDRPVKGWWRYGNNIQILPPPQGAPVPHEMIGQWPFLVELRFRAPTKPGPVVQGRRMRASRELQLLLPVLLIGPLFFPHHPYRSVKHWVLPSGAEQPASRLQRIWTRLGMRTKPSEGLPIYAQELYMVPGFKSGGPELTNVSAPPLRVVDDVTVYVNQRGSTGDEELEVPTNLADLFDKYYALSNSDKNKYLRACYRMNLGRFYWNYSFSTSFFAYVVAIESLLDDEQPHTCTSCGGPHHPSITQAFRRFLSTYAPDTPERQRFYSMRSGIAHGSKLLASDEMDEVGAFDPVRIEEMSEHVALNLVVRAALVNWLASQPLPPHAVNADVVTNK
jgi:hypothetical protein